HQSDAALIARYRREAQSFLDARSPFDDRPVQAFVRLDTELRARQDVEVIVIDLDGPGPNAVGVQLVRLSVIADIEPAVGVVWCDGVVLSRRGLGGIENKAIEVVKAGLPLPELILVVGALLLRQITEFRPGDVGYLDVVLVGELDAEGLGELRELLARALVVRDEHGDILVPGTIANLVSEAAFAIARATEIRGPRIIAVAGNRGHLWGEQHRIETRTKRNHSRVNSGRLTIGGNYSRSP